MRQPLATSMLSIRVGLSLPGGALLFFFNDTATTEIYPLSLHDALPISRAADRRSHGTVHRGRGVPARDRSEEHTSELQSRLHLVCRLLLEKKTTTHRA